MEYSESLWKMELEDKHFMVKKKKIVMYSLFVKHIFNELYKALCAGQSHHSRTKQEQKCL